jgi:hypothetical protein
MMEALGSVFAKLDSVAAIALMSRMFLQATI